MRFSYLLILTSLLSACASHGSAVPSQKAMADVGGKAAATAGVPSLGGIKLGDSDEVLKGLHLTLKRSSADAPGGSGAKSYTYVTANGNELSVTFEGGKAVWIENDWMGEPDDDGSLIKGLLFGKTTSMDIRALTGSSGYAHRNVAFHRMGDSLASFICYGLVDQPGTSLVVINDQSLATAPDDVRKYGVQVFHLASVILATDDYLDSLWGKETVQDPAYHPIAWSAVDRQPDDAAVESLKHATDVLISTVTTTEDRFSISLPVGFHRVSMPVPADPGLYTFTDAGKYRMISLDLVPDDDRKRDASGYLTDMMRALSMMHTQFQYAAFTKSTVSGLEFACSEWSGIKEGKLFGGRTCVADRGVGHVIYADLDIKHRYDDDKAVYQQVFDSLHLD